MGIKQNHRVRLQSITVFRRDGTTRYDVLPVHFSGDRRAEKKKTSHAERDGSFSAHEFFAGEDANPFDPRIPLSPLCLSLSQYHQYHIVGRHVPTEADPNPQVFRMKLWSLDDTRAKSKFW